MCFHTFPFLFKQANLIFIVRNIWLIKVTFMHWRRKWQPTPVFLPGESQGQGSLVGCRLWGRTELDTTEATLQQQQQQQQQSHMKVLVIQLCLTLLDSMDCSLSGSVYGIFQARILKWVAISFSRGSYRSRDRTQASRIVGRSFTV